MSEETKIPAEQAQEPAKNKPKSAGKVSVAQRSTRSTRSKRTYVYVENPTGGVNRIEEIEAIKLVRRKKGYRIVDAPKTDK